MFSGSRHTFPLDSDPPSLPLLCLFEPFPLVFRNCRTRHSLRSEVLAERRRADEAECDAKDGRRLRSLAAAGAGGSSARDDDDSDGDDAAGLRRKLELATSEIEALRTHTTDLRNQIQSGWWSWRPAASETVAGGEGNDPASRGGGAGTTGVSDGACSLRAAAAAAAAEAAVLGRAGAAADIVGGGRSGRDDGSASIELDRLTSLLAERDAQIGVLTSTVEALQTSPLIPSQASPRKSGGGGGGAAAASSTRSDRINSNGHSAVGCACSPRLRASRRDDSSHRHQATASTAAAAAVSPRSFWPDASGTGGMMEAAHDGVDGVNGVDGVGALNHVAAQGLARRCVALTVRLTSAIAREGRAERRADRLAEEAARRERRIAEAAAVEEELARRNRAVESAGRKASAALNGLRAESAARLREAGDEASKLR